MSRKIFWLYKALIKPGKNEATMILVKDMILAVDAENSGVLNYEWFVDDKAATCRCYARFKDCESVERYLAMRAQGFDSRCMMLMERHSLRVFGSVSATLKSKLEAMGAEFSEPTAGFSR